MEGENADLLVNFTPDFCSYDCEQRVCLVPASCVTYPAALSSTLLSWLASASTSDNILAPGMNP
jgi:hypothetical protein